MNSREAISYVPDSDKDGGWGWVIVAATFFIRVIVDGFIYTFGIFYVEFLEYFKCTSGAASLVMSLLVGVCYLVGPIASGLINKYGCRIVSSLGTAVACIGLLLSLPVPRVEYLLITIGLISGTGFGFLYLPTIISVALHFEKKRATAMGISMAGSGIGALIFAPLLEWLVFFYSNWTGAMLISTGILLNCFVLSMFYRKFHPPVNNSDQNEEPSPDEPSSSTYSPESGQSGFFSQKTQTPEEGNPIQGEYTITSKVAKPSSSVTIGKVENIDIFYTGSADNLVSRQIYVTPSMLLHYASSLTVQKNTCLRFTGTVANMMGLSLLKNYVFLIYALGTTLHYLGLIVPSMYLFHMSVEIGVATTFQASLLLSFMGISNTIGKVSIGFLADITTWSATYMYAICLLITGIATMLTPVLNKYYLLVLYGFIFGFTWGGSISLSSIVLVSLLGLARLSNSYGLSLLFTGIASSVGPPVAGE
ncbi:monocarboxylate transporter 7 [Trichonephila inaurata madagascariensis]|uniref:Monocarboxylate transporter 7 n=1 Tax=Trichonephila inaurata madagascariensis TaxID=2747483 RepID=A0A8X6WZQ3_9ARAC|nr:monocarboxylate transporter 7 [Trichonephila inaurata madagascariensis]